MAYTVTITHDAAALARLQEEWPVLMADSAAQNVFMTWEWITTWWAHFAARGELWLVAARDESGALVGLAPLILVQHNPAPTRRVSPGVLAWRQLEFIGASTDSDHLDFIIKRGVEADVLPAMLDALRAEASRWDVLNLSGIPETSPTLPLLQADDQRWENSIPPRECPVVDLPEDWETFFMSAVSRRKRKEQRRFLRQLDEAFPERWQWRVVTDPGEAETTLDFLIDMHQAKWEALGAPGAFADPAMVAFLHDVVRRLLPKNWVHLYRIDLDGTMAAALCTFVYADRVSDFVSGFDFDYADYSPGQVLTEMALRQAIDAGVTHYDFLRGDEKYKFRWGAEVTLDHTLRWVTSRKVYVVESGVEAARNAWTRVKGWLPEDARDKLRDSLK